MTTPPTVFVTPVTAANAGAIAVIHLRGPGVPDILIALTGIKTWHAGVMKLVEFSDIDQGMAVVMGHGESLIAELFPHGGMRVVEKLIDRLLALGAAFDAHPPTRSLYPEADCYLEADALATLAPATSPAAINLLLAQKNLWRVFASQGDLSNVEAILARTVTLDRLITPPTVVVVGQPNVGKSTLTNRMLGRSASLVADLPGTTRDWVAGLAEISFTLPKPADEAHPLFARGLPPLSQSRFPGNDGIAVQWLDTPGLRVTSDVIEARAIELARQVIAGADVLILLRDPRIGFPDVSALPRGADLWVMNKCDTLSPAPEAGDGLSMAHPLPVSAAEGTGLDDLQNRIIAQLGLETLTPELWAFSSELKTLLASRDAAALARYVMA